MSLVTGNGISPTGQCPRPAPDVRTRRRGKVYLLYDARRDKGFRLNATAGFIWILFNR